VVVYVTKRPWLYGAVIGVVFAVLWGTVIFHGSITERLAVGTMMGLFWGATQGMGWPPTTTTAEHKRRLGANVWRPRHRSPPWHSALVSARDESVTAPDFLIWNVVVVVREMADAYGTTVLAQPGDAGIDRHYGASVRAVHLAHEVARFVLPGHPESLNIYGPRSSGRPELRGRQVQVRLTD
jgi:hypothetical protein